MKIEIILWTILAMLVLNILLVLYRKKDGKPSSRDLIELEKWQTILSAIDPLLRKEFATNREEQLWTARANREEMQQSFKVLGENLSRHNRDVSTYQKEQLQVFAQELQALMKENEERMNQLLLSIDQKQAELREQLDTSGRITRNELNLALDKNETKTGELVTSFDEKSKQLYEQSNATAKENRTELSTALKSFEENFTNNVKNFNELQRQKFSDLGIRQEQLRVETNTKLEKIRDTMELKLQILQTENSKKLEEMRITVDEKLQSTVEKRFNESFKVISERLEQVHKGLGEMQSLASGVGDLKKVLSNVKTRGNMGEIQLGAILEQILSPEQYNQNAIVKNGSQERVEYVVKLPGRNENNTALLLPIDSKFPNEDYQRLQEAYENIANLEVREIEIINKQFEQSVKKNAKDIKDKYINPPITTDFAIMFVPTEGLYAEILRRPGLFESLQRDYRITVVGPTNLVAFLSSLHMGFRTLAIERRSGEVWQILGAVKTEFGHFGAVLEKTKKKLLEATNTIDKAGVRTRAIERQLRKVQELPQEEAANLLETTNEPMEWTEEDSSDVET